MLSTNSTLVGGGVILPNVSICTTEGDVHYNPYVPPTPVETRVVATFNVTDTSNPTQLGYYQYTSGFSSIEIDGAEQSVVSAYTFDAVGEHTVKYTLKDPTSIGDYAFYSCSGLTSVTIPNSITSIGNSAFVGCVGLTSINIPSGVTSIGNSAFVGCVGLTNITILDSVTSIEQSAFSYCSGLTSVTIGSGVTTIGSSAFRGCDGLTSIVSNTTTAPTIQSNTFRDVKTGGTLTVPSGSSGYDVWMGTGNYYLGKYNWTKVEQ